MPRRWVTVESLDPRLPDAVWAAMKASEAQAVAGTSADLAVTPTGLAAHAAQVTLPAAQDYTDNLVAAIHLPTAEDEQFQTEFGAPPVTASSTAWYGYPMGTATTLALTLNRQYFLPVPLSAPTRTIFEVAVTTTASAAAGGVIRFGLHDTNSGGEPGDLISDLGTVDTTVAPGTLTKSVGVEVTPFRRLLWISVTAQVAACSTRAVGTFINSLLRTGTAAAATQTNVARIRAGVTGALPNPANADDTGTGTAPVVAVRFADGAGSDFDTLQALITANTTIPNASYSATGLVATGNTVQGTL